MVPGGAAARATIEQRAAGVPAGLGVAEAVFARLDPEISLHGAGRRGHLARARVRWRSSTGPAAGDPGRERVALNFLGRLSGVATLTARFVRAVEGTGARILDTRKTTPGLRELEKDAVRAGGGTNHRRGLYDAVLVKENHSALAGGVGEATRRALAGAPAGVTVEVECASLAEVDEALAAGAGRILLDNMDPGELRARGRARGRPRGARGIGRSDARERASGGRDRGRLDQRRGAHALGARARREPDAPRALNSGSVPSDEGEASFRHRERFETCRPRRCPVREHR